jgi:hypothetical protein
VAGVRDPQALLLKIDVVVRLLEEHLEGPEHRVRSCDLGDDRDQRVVVIRDRGEVLRLLRADVPRIPAPEVGLPRRVEPDLVVDVAVVDQGRVVRLVLAQAHRRRVADRGLELRILIADRDAQLRLDSMMRRAATCSGRF